MEYVTRADEQVPVLGLGTWQMDEETTYRSVQTALELGYRHIDTAQLYENESAVGRAITDSPVDREEVFLTTKVAPTHRTVGEIVRSTERSVEKLGVDTVDLLLIHWPHPLAELGKVIAGLNETVAQGLTRHIGVSNFDVERLDRARTLSSVPIFTNQVLFHPWWPQRELLEYCQKNNVILTAYSPLANGWAVDDDLLSQVGATYDKTGPQTALRWTTQHKDVMTIPQSGSRDHLAENIDIFDFKLTAEDHDRITRPSYLKTGLAQMNGMF